ncbi:MAG: L,D-transpeptidase [Myxococcales bacterium]|nr:L,D-transpeptidase [Myxococcales bacterium]MCB9705766.1 L,D-transpeptidase [Myxococcales bacterium]
MSLAPALAVLTAASALGNLEPVGEDAAAIHIEATDVHYIETRWTETVIRGRPWVPHRRLATLAKGTRLVVRGVVESRDKAGCEGKPWYAVYPFGFVCSREVRPSKSPPSTAAALTLTDDRTLPFDYVLVRESGTPMYRSDAEAIAGTPHRLLADGMSLAAGRTREVGGVLYLETADGMLIPKDKLGWMGKGSAWEGVTIDEEVAVGPAFAWTSRDKTPVFAEASATGEPIERLPKRQRLQLSGDAVTTDAGRFWPVGEGRWVEDDKVNAVVFIDPPAGVLQPQQLARGNDQWIDVDLGEQVLVAYRGHQPVFATMVSSGKGSPTPRGNYPIWAKVASMTMGNQDYEDKPYMVEHVPWVLLFQGHNALHGAYWHDRFGQRRSHGCVNLAPKDARWIFEWVAPTLPEGWTGYLPGDLAGSVVVHVRDTSLPTNEAFIQERPIGPPDPEEEKRKKEDAEARRAESRAAEADPSAAVAAHAPDPGSPIDPEVNLPD